MLQHGSWWYRCHRVHVVHDSAPLHQRMLRALCNQAEFCHPGWSAAARATLTERVAGSFTTYRVACAQECNAIDRCFTCVPGEGGCSPIRTYNRLFVAEHGRLAGAHAMKAEIAARGPISCGIDATLALDEYEGALTVPACSPVASLNRPTVLLTAAVCTRGSHSLSCYVAHSWQGCRHVCPFDKMVLIGMQAASLSSTSPARRSTTLSA